MKFFYRLSSDDIFISYSRRDPNNLGRRYAVNLYEELKKRGFSSFMDSLGAEPGPTQPESLNHKIRNSKMLVVIGTERACQSTFVEEEIKVFLNSRRLPIVPIDFDGMIPNAHWYPLVEGVALESESQEALTSGIPSAEVIARIEEAFQYTKRNDQLRRATFGTLGILTVLILASIGASVFAWQQLSSAKQAKFDAEETANLANLKTEEANKAEIRANKATARADSEASRAKEQELIANTKTEEANKATKLAEDKTKEAGEKTKLADAATKKAELAEEREKIANDTAKRQQLQTRTTLAENYYNIAETEARIEPIKALPWIQKSIDTVPVESNQLGFYKLRALHWTQNIPYSVTNTMLYESYIEAFSPSLDKVILNTDDNNRKVWNLKTGTPITIPSDKNPNNPINFFGSIFSPNSKWIAGFTSEKSAEGNDIRCLIVWEAIDAENVWKNCDPHLQILTNSSDQYHSNSFKKQPLNLFFSSDSNSIIANLPATTEKDVTEKKRKVLVWDVTTSQKKPLLITSDVPIQDLVTRNNQTKEEPTHPTSNYEKDKESKENYRRNKISISNNPERNWIITIKNQAESSIAYVLDINKNEIKKEMKLEKFIDFIDFSGDANFIFTISHNGDGERIHRIWNSETKEDPQIIRTSPNYSIIALSKTGGKMLITDEKDQYRYICMTVDKDKMMELSCSSPILVDPPLYDIYASFTEDEQYLITESIEKKRWGYDEVEIPTQEWNIDVWDADNFLAGLKVKPTLTLNRQTEFGLSKSSAALAIVSENGTIRLQSLLPKNKQFSLPSEENTFLQDTYLTPDFKNLLTFGEPSNGNTEVKFWRIENNKPDFVWSNSINEVQFEKPGIQNIDINRDGTRFLVVHSDYSGAIFATVRRLDNGEDWRLDDEENAQDLQPITGDFFKQAIFNRDGSKILTFGSTVWQWNASTQTKDKSFKMDIEHKEDFLSFTRYGEYIIFYSQGFYTERSFSIIQTGGDKDSFNEFQFLNRETAALAISLLRQAQEIKFQGKGNLIAVINPSLTISIEVSDQGAFIYNKESKKRILIPKTKMIPAFDTKISSDGKYILGKSGSFTAGRYVTDTNVIRIWSAETGFPITDEIWHEGLITNYDFTPEGNKVMTVTLNGVIRTWFIGSLKDGLPVWMKGMGEALTGIEINDGNEPKNIPQDKYFNIRCSYLRKLREAIKQGDLNAQFVLENLKPDDRFDVMCLGK